MTAILKDNYRMSLMLATLFFLGTIISVYTIYSIPHNLMLTDVYQGALAPVYAIVGATFLLGALTIWYALRYKNEVIVYRDKQLEQNTERESHDSGLTTISLEQVKTNLRQSKDNTEILQSGLYAVCKQLEAGQGAIYLTTEKNGVRKVELQTGYALSIGESKVISFEFGEGLVGQAAAGAKTMYIDDIPEGYIKIISGLGSASPRYLMIVPLKKAGKVLGVIEIASFTPITDDQRKFVEESAQLIADSMSGN